MRVREVIRRLLQDGWTLDANASRGKVRVFRHHSAAGKVTVAGADDDMLPPYIASSILHQAGIIP